jgi:molybdate transport system substrate-binding protein
MSFAMSWAPRRVAAGLAVFFVLVATACAGSSKPSSSDTGAPSGATTAPAATSKLTGSLDVFAASSLTKAFNTEKTNLEKADAGLSLTYNFAGSQALVTQIQQGAPADVFASADTSNMQKLVDAGLVEAPKTFAHNLLEIAVARGNPKKITSLADLEKPGVTLVLADASVPAGKYARQAFTKAGLPAPKPVSDELDVKSTLAKLTLGEADAVVVYVSDVKGAGDKVMGITIPDAQNVLATYPIAAVKASKNLTAAEAFVDEIAAGSGRQALAVAGFMPPS